ncbi:MAG: hypothetical protein LBC87_08115 [Fibromonadaceae bacterium]|nr:hypothetical protein [Fibromonadaceae bacterium]
MKKLALLTLCAGLFYSCTVYEMPSSSSSRAGESSSSSEGASSSSAVSKKYCVEIAEPRRCQEVPLTETKCITGYELSTFCP